MYEERGAGGAHSDGVAWAGSKNKPGSLVGVKEPGLTFQLTFNGENKTPWRIFVSPKMGLNNSH